ncbi:1,4-dihydroxy-2-naphthoate polyprenyltransferase [Bacillota bacterium]
MAAFFNYVEIKTKITSVFAFLMTLSFIFYMEQEIDLLKTSIFFAAMFLFDLTTTSINNYIDTRNNGKQLPFKRRNALAITYLLFAVSAALGIGLVILTDIIVLAAGGLCFLCGVFYTYGPIPISRQPWGEILSGTFYGLLIPFIILYINMPSGYYLTLDLSLEAIGLQVQVMPFIALLLISVNPVCCTANIMLANNVCDLENDIKVKRYTLPYYLGSKALKLFARIYYSTYFATLIMAAAGIIHPICLLSILTIIPVRKNIKIFQLKQEKETTFIVSIKNYVLIMGAFTLTVFVSGLLS